MNHARIASLIVFVCLASASPARAQQSPEERAKSNAEQEKRAAQWVDSLKLDDAEKVTRVKDVIVTHLKAVRDWHNEHPFTAVPEGINPLSGKPLSSLDEIEHAILDRNDDVPRRAVDRFNHGVTGAAQPNGADVVEANRALAWVWSLGAHPDRRTRTEGLRITDAVESRLT